MSAEEVVVPNAQESHEHRQVPLKGGGAEVFVHLVETVQHGAKVIRADGHHRRKSDRRIHGVASADPIPEPEHVGGINAELGHFRRIGRYRNKMLGDRLFVPSEALQVTNRGPCAHWSWFRGW